MRKPKFHIGDCVGVKDDNGLLEGPTGCVVDVDANDERVSYNVDLDDRPGYRMYDETDLMLIEAAQRSVIKDSGDRTEFESGAVRDMREGKGRCDLLPLDVMGSIFSDDTFRFIDSFTETGNVEHLYCAVLMKRDDMFADLYTMALEVAKHFEDGAKKYGDNNWRKGIPAHVYIDSGLRHYFKFKRGDKDEPHDRAFYWNMLCCIWTCTHKPELNTYLNDKEGTVSA